MTNQEILHETNEHLKEIARQLMLITESLQRMKKPPMYIVPNHVADKGRTLPDPRPF